MPTFNRRSRRRENNKRLKRGRGIVNTLINKLPFELHLPGGYQYCGPGTKLQKRLARGDPGINELDKACKQHDIAYSQSDLAARHKADYQLEQTAWERVKSKDAGIGEKAAAWLVTNIMKGKQKLGMGCRNRPKSKTTVLKKKKKQSRIKRIAFGSGIVSKVRQTLRKFKHKSATPKDVQKVAHVALQAARRYLKDAGGKRRIRTPRIIPIPKVGGILPLIPIFAGLSALGGLAGGAAGIAKVVNEIKSTKDQLTEATRHNKNMEAIALGKRGSGVYLKPYRKGLGLYLNPQKSKNY
ncbi:hypothetical protein NQ317_013649 [Molorchus minor]|uniref:Phospholipase A2-like domain-containing protein n=1 Tax=Molorchus minor TaxID=1323400 RepID=A0ABQ9JXG7_9CUCU|nr:hypothetical protein NQ317_013649 [Molorchus minor]